MTIPFNTSNMAGVNYSEIFVAPSSTGYPYGTTIPTFTVGQMSVGADGTVWVYCKYGTGGSTGLGYIMTFDEDFLAVMMSNSVGGLGDKIGLSPAAALVDNYGWIQVYGVADNIRVAASDAANAVQASTTTAGEIDDAVGTGTKNLTGIILTTARAASAGLAPGTLNWPVIGTTN